MEAAGLKMTMSQREFNLMSEQHKTTYLAIEEIYKEMHIKELKIYAKYQPTIKAFKAKQKIELDELYKWRNSLLDKCRYK
jgi:hypothetical protein